MSKVKGLCCAINPCYVCESCHYRECQEHWLETLAKKTFHFNEHGYRCSVTGKAVQILEPRDNIVVYYRPI